MVRQLTTKAQVNGYRFIQRRQEHALVRHDARMLHDPMSAQRTSLLIGAVIAVLLLGGCGIYGLIRPQGSVGDATVLVSKDNGGLYVRRGEVVHPVLNLASARLIVGSAATPKSVSDAVLARYGRGPLLGIPGAPSALVSNGVAGESSWAVCDTSTAVVDDPELVRTSVIIGGSEVPNGGGGRSMLVRSGTSTFLIYSVADAGSRRVVRALVNPDDAPVVRALGMTGLRSRPVSTSLLNSIPQVPDLVVPTLDDVGARASYAPQRAVGTVIKTSDASGATSLHVVLRDGVQRISTVVADMLAMSTAAVVVENVPAAELVRLPLSQSLHVGQYPGRKPSILGVDVAPVACHQWRRRGDAIGQTELRFAATLRPDRRVTTPVGADGAGPGVDEVVVAPGSGLYVQTTGVELASNRRQSRYFISDNGIRYGVADASTARILGFTDSPGLAPWPILSLLAAGPMLSPSEALVAHGGMAPDPGGVGVSPDESE